MPQADRHGVRPGEPDAWLPITGLSLAERRALLAQAGRARLPPDVGAEAARTVEWWERKYFHGNRRLFTRRLRAGGLDRIRAAALVAAGREQSPHAGVGVPPWPLDPGTTPLPTEHGVLAGNASRRVGEAVGALPLDVDRAVVMDRFVDSLIRRLNGIALRTFAVEMSLSRIAGRLRGDTSEARFRNWAHENVVDPDGYRRLLDRYPGLLRVLVSTTAHATEAWCEMLAHLGEDWAAVSRTFTGGTLVDVETPDGDLHRGGRQVMFLHFASGRRVVYKPRSMAVDVHFYALLRWLEDRGLDPAMRTVTVLDRGDRGWMEFITPEPCRTLEEVRTFYHRQGVLLMVLYLLNGVDSHAENIVAGGPHPVLVDLEAMFQVEPAGAGDVRRRLFNETVLKTGMLPQPRTGSAGTVELGGLAETSDQRTPYKVPSWQGFGTDQMRLVTVQLDMKEQPNVPTLDGRVVPAHDHLEDVVGGFTQAYGVVVAHRDELAAPEGPLAAFGGDQVRHVLRNTAEYDMLLRGSYHPSCLRDAVHRDFVFDSLWLQAEQDVHLGRVIESERADLWDGDIPVFTATVSGTDLEDSRGTLIEGFLASSGMERVLARLRRLDNEDLARQVACIWGSVQTVAGAPAAPAMVSDADRPATGDALLAAATRVGDRLSTLALRHGDRAHWMGQVGERGLPPAWNVVNADLYEGTAGIALFLASLGVATGREDFEQLARAAANDVVGQLRSWPLVSSPGAFTGVPGLLYSLSRLAGVWDDPKLAAHVTDTLERLPRRWGSAPASDLLGGVAGCILVMLRLAEQFPTHATPALEAATACGRVLLRRAVVVDDALAWPPDGPGSPLTGMSHGVAGIAWALGELSVATGDVRFGRVARRALQYERRLFNPELGNWPDFRSFDDEPGPGQMREPYLWGWCHGAPGIGLARLMIRQRCPGLFDVASLDEDIGAALASTEAHGFADGHCLCHGDLGNAELFLTASSVLGEPRYRDVALRRAHAVLVDRETTGAWRCNRRDLVELPGLMMGLAGIGYGLLRLRDPEGVPSLLTLG